jgi:LmbE family N-acetylglucosaminyl deacetylase
MNREILHVITNKKKLSASMRGIIVEAHPDDTAMAMLDSALVKKDVGLTVATFTDGAARNLPRYTPEKLREERRKESPKSLKILGAAQVFGADLPDGELIIHQEQAREFLADVIARVKPNFLIAPHPEDTHVDHATAGMITKEIAGGIPVYFMDTITGKDRHDNLIFPTHVAPLSRRDIRIRRRSYLAHKSQVLWLPAEERQAVQEVLAMPQRRGKEFDMRNTGILVKDMSYISSDPIAEIFQKNIVVIPDGKSKLQAQP